jgi:hypothetical protein
MNADKKDVKTVFMFSKTLMFVLICCFVIFGIFCLSAAVFTIITQGGEPNIPAWFIKVFPIIIVFPGIIAFRIPSFFNTITITDRLIEIGKTPAFEKSEIAKISISKVEGYFSLFSIIEFEFKDAEKMARISPKFAGGKYRIEGYISDKGIQTLHNI